MRLRLPGQSLLILVALVLLITIGLIYYGRGVPFLYFPDSAGYLQQAASFHEPGGYRVTAARSIGYPAFLAAASLLPANALSIVLLQALAATAAYVLLALHLRRALPAVTGGEAGLLPVSVALLPVWLCATASYSALHVFIAAMLPEVLFCALIALALATVTQALTADRISWRMLLTVALAGAFCALPMLFKPHWLLAGPALLLLLLGRLLWLVRQRASPSLKPWARRATSLILAIPIAAFIATLWPERAFDHTSTSPVAAFGARSIFCNRLPLINAALAKNPAMRLSPSEADDGRLRAAMRTLQNEDKSPWKVMGFDGDRCMYASDFHDMVGEAFPRPEQQKAFYLGTYTAAVRADPIPFVRMLLRQIVLGFEKTFDMFAVHGDYIDAAETLGPAFLAGTRKIAAGPLNAPARTRTTLLGMVVNGALAVFFWAHEIAYLAVMLATLGAPAFRWRTWSGDRRRAFAVYLAVPLVVILAHHTVVGLSHTFDIRRYAFNLYFVNLAFVACGSLFWLTEWRTLRASRGLH